MVLIVLSIIALLPFLYPLNLLIKKRDLNLFDLVILFHTLNFVINPLIYGERLNLDDGIVFQEFIYYFSFIITILALSLFWHNKNANKINLVNITKYIAQYKEVKVNLIGKALLVIAIIVSLVFYLPRATYILHVEELGVEVDYQTKAAVSIWGVVWNFLGIFSLCLLYYLINIKS